MVASDIQASRMSKYSDKKENASKLCKGYPVPEKKRKRKVYLETTNTIRNFSAMFLTNIAYICKYVR